MTTAIIGHRMTSEEVFTRYQPLAYKMGAKIAAKYRTIQRQDFMDEAQSILGELAAQWNTEGSTYCYNSKVSPSTWIYRNLYWFLTTFAQRKQPKLKAVPFSVLDRDDEKPIDVTDRMGWMENLMRNLGEDAKIIVQTILFAPAEIAEDLGDIAKGVDLGRKDSKWWPFWAYLSRQGWEVDRIKTAWREVEVAL